ncbi:MAG: bifunctional adenosylcobinamide kinase/adenosylcobinamide-phosphate guanylyltransferase [Candidatus Omnitrophota bacterium]
MGKLIFITGGSRSGKSSLAVKLAQSSRKDKVFVATCVPIDKEMKERVALHKKNRPSSWKTIEESRALASLLRKEAASRALIIIDCLTLFVSSLMMKGRGEDEIKKEVAEITAAVKNGKSDVIIVSNEVGCGLVPESKLGRRFRDIAGSVNQIVASRADEVIYMISGLPLILKREK